MVAPINQLQTRVLIHVPALVIAVEMLTPKAIAATAMPVPTMARISAYSAAAAPDSSRSILVKVFMATSSEKITGNQTQCGS